MLVIVYDTEEFILAGLLYIVGKVEGKVRRGGVPTHHKSINGSFPLCYVYL